MAPSAACSRTQASSTGLRALAMNPPARTDTSRSTSSAVAEAPRTTTSRCPARSRLPPLTTCVATYPGRAVSPSAPSLPVGCARTSPAASRTVTPSTEDWIQPLTLVE